MTKSKVFDLHCLCGAFAVSKFHPIDSKRQPMMASGSDQSLTLGVLQWKAWHLCLAKMNNRTLEFAFHQSCPGLASGFPLEDGWYRSEQYSHWS